MPRKDPEAYKAYMRDYMKRKYQEKKGIKQVDKMSEDDFNVTEAVLPQEGKQAIDLNGKAAKALLDTAKKASKDPDTDEEDPVFKYIEKGMKYLPVIIEAFKGFNAAAANFQQTQRPAQNQAPAIQPPDGWETMTALQRLSKKYSRPEWYAAGERWEEYKASGGASYVTPVNTNYVDPAYNQAVAQRQTQANQEARSLSELKNKYPEPPAVSDAPPQMQEAPTQEPPQEQKQEPEFIKKAQEKRGEQKDKPKTNEEAETMLVNAMREDNNKYIEMAFNYLNGLSMEQFKDYVQNIDKLKPKFKMLKMFLPVQTREMLKNTSSAEFVDIFKTKSPDKYKWLKDEKKIPEMKKLFDELKAGL